ncbi:hypothetical protein M9H77_35415 [Catharanthus roseus]|uniref:Uncharacterized protein n=1 Tax=Catharanthus roseus TaxID=4058 RepID=A0ACB9ZPP1_CATRO|nr:hypothetical protein M9H77_35415 [Catharanthus roseus]
MLVMSKISRSRNKRPDKVRDIPVPTQRRKVKSSDWEQTGPADRGPVDPELIPLYRGHVAVILIIMELFDVATDLRSRLSSSDRLHALISMYFPIFAPAVRSCTQSCKTHIQQFPMLGHKSEHKLLDIRLQLYMMSVDEISVLAILPSACTDDYMDWFLPPTYPRIQNLVNVPCGFHVPVGPPVPLSALMDMIAREVHRDDVGKEEKYDKIANLVKRHYSSGTQ